MSRNKLQQTAPIAKPKTTSKPRSHQHDWQATSRPYLVSCSTCGLPAVKEPTPSAATELFIQWNSLHNRWQVIMALGNHANWLLPDDIPNDFMTAAHWLKNQINGHVRVGLAC